MSAPAAALRRDLDARLGPRGALLRAAAAAARTHGAHAYLVGGPVRDLLLGREIGDLDVLLSDGLAEVARAVAAEIGGQARMHARFLTATVFAGALRLDLARARRERYARPGALPDVEPAEVAADLARRDFALHALALPLDVAAGPRLLDPHGGEADLAARRHRILHPRSFEDDPTRLFRASRYAARLGFRLDALTARAFSRALAAGLVNRLSGDRVRHEIERLLDEADVARTVRRAERDGLIEAIAGGFRTGARARAALTRYARVRARPPWTAAADATLLRAAGLRLALLDARPRARRAALARLGLRGRPAEAIDADAREVSRLLSALAPAKPGDGDLDARLCGASDPLLVALVCAAPSALAKRVLRYARDLRQRPDPIDGLRARSLGLEGPAIGHLLRAARRRVLDGRPVDARWLARAVAAARAIH